MLDNIHEPFDAALNDAVIDIANRVVGPFTVSDDAPNTYKSLCTHLNSGKQMVVAAEGSDATIFGAAPVNYAFRAWHDWCHWKGGYDFSLQGEMDTCCLQLIHIQMLYGVNQRTCYWRTLLIAEVIGQRQYYELYREYISNQRAFATAYMEDRNAALARKW